MAQPLTDEQRDEVAERVGLALRAGYEPDDEIVEGIVEALSDETGAEAAVVTPLVQAILADVRAELVVETSSWSGETDYDRLHAAFGELTRAGIVARENFSCCMNCGRGEIAEVMAKSSARGLSVRGFAFFHEQDTERAASGCGLNIAFGGTTGNAAAIANEIVAVLRARSLRAHWSGDLNRRIEVELEWRRRIF